MEIGVEGAAVEREAGRNYEFFPRIPMPFWSRFCTELSRMATEPQSGQTGEGAGADRIALQQPTTLETSMPEISAEAELVQSTMQLGDVLEAGALNPTVAQISVEIDVAVPIRKFRVRNLLALSTGQVIGTEWLEGEDLPLGARGAQLAWTEFEVIDQKLAVRVTRLV
jgi:flagellar motor switch protein FliN/FliY